MRKKQWTCALTTTLLLAGSTLLADLTGVVATPQKVVIGNMVSAKATDDGNPPISAATMNWTYNCTACGATKKPWTDGTCVSWIDDFQINATATWNIPSFPTATTRVSGPISTTVNVIPPDQIKMSFPNGNGGTLQGNNFAITGDVVLKIQATAQGSPLGFCAAPIIEERIYRDAKWGTVQKGWGPWTGAGAGQFEWDAQSSSIIDTKRRLLPQGINPATHDFYPPGTPIDEIIQVIRLTFPKCCGGTRWFIFWEFQVTTFAAQNGYYTMGFTTPPNPMPPFPPGT